MVAHSGSRPGASSQAAPVPSKNKNGGDENDELEPKLTESGTVSKRPLATRARQRPRDYLKMDSYGPRARQEFAQKYGRRKIEEAEEEVEQ